MKSKDILIILFLAGLLLYAACHRAGIVGQGSVKKSTTGVILPEERLPVSIQFEQWVFSAHPENGLTVSTGSGDTIHHIPLFRSHQIEVISKPDTTGQSLGFLIVSGDQEDDRPCFRMMKDGLLEKASS